MVFEPEQNLIYNKNSKTVAKWKNNIIRNSRKSLWMQWSLPKILIFNSIYLNEFNQQVKIYCLINIERYPYILL